MRYVSCWWEMISIDNVKLAQREKEVAGGKQESELYVRGNKL